MPWGGVQVVLTADFLQSRAFPDAVNFYTPLLLAVCARPPLAREPSQLCFAIASGRPSILSPLSSRAMSVPSKTQGGLTSLPKCAWATTAWQILIASYLRPTMSRRCLYAAHWWTRPAKRCAAQAAERRWSRFVDFWGRAPGPMPADAFDTTHT